MSKTKVKNSLYLRNMPSFFSISGLTIQPSAQSSLAKTLRIKMTSTIYLACYIKLVIKSCLTDNSNFSVPTASAQPGDWCGTVPPSFPCLPCPFHLRLNHHQKSLPEACFLPPHLPLTPPQLRTPTVHRITVLLLVPSILVPFSPPCSSFMIVFFVL